MAKNPNYLAPPIERQRQFKYPKQHKIKALMALTDRVKQVWQSLLPDEVISSLMVVQQDKQQLVITTNNHTIANHLNYTYRVLLDSLYTSCPDLQGISQIKFTVINAPHTLVNSGSNSTIKSNSDVSSVTSRKLSITTRQNITQLAQDVTHNPRLASILLKLAADK